MMKMPLISIIVPVYNIESYIFNCVDSIIKQTYKNLEIILIDDGSSDSSYEICSKFMEIDDRIILLAKDNGGPAEARNYGLDISTGEYIMFVDGDDIIAHDYIRVLYSDLYNCRADISISSWEDIADGDGFNEVRQTDYSIIMDKNMGLKKLLYQESYDTQPWGKLYKAKLFNDIRFPNGKLYEDMAILYLVFAKADKVVYHDYSGYYYTIRNGGIMLSDFKESKMDLIHIADEMYFYIIKNYKTLELAAMSRVVRANFHIYLQIPSGRDYLSYRKIVARNIKKFRVKVLADKNAKRGTRITLLISFLGFWLIRAIRKYKFLAKQ